MDILKQRNFLLSEIKINIPLKKIINSGGELTGIEGYKNFIIDNGKIIKFLEPILNKKYANDEGLGKGLIDLLIYNMKLLHKKYNLRLNEEGYSDWLMGYINDIGLPKLSSGSLWTAIIDDEYMYGEEVSNVFDIDEETLYDYYNYFKTW